MSDEKPYHHGDLRAALLTAAEAELAERGVEAFSLRSVAKRAGVSHAAPYRHFKDREALLSALAESVIFRSSRRRIRSKNNSMTRAFSSRQMPQKYLKKWRRFCASMPLLLRWVTG